LDDVYTAFAPPGALAQSSRNDSIPEVKGARGLSASSRDDDDEVWISKYSHTPTKILAPNPRREDDHSGTLARRPLHQITASDVNSVGAQANKFFRHNHEQAGVASSGKDVFLVRKDAAALQARKEEQKREARAEEERARLRRKELDEQLAKLDAAASWDWENLKVCCVYVCLSVYVCMCVLCMYVYIYIYMHMYVYMMQVEIDEQLAKLNADAWPPLLHSRHI
jgi:hypothetical protein